MAFLVLVLSWLALILYTDAQSISTSRTLPPLQWLLLETDGSSKPPPLKDASIGYDELNRNIILFGGESEGGFPQDKTYLLNLDNLIWSSPRSPSNLQDKPSARSAAVAGVDFAASNRHGFLVVGGKDSDGNALSDVWEFDFINQFWSQVSVPGDSPSARYGAAGGIDFRTPPDQDPIVPGPNNTFYYAGGQDGTSSTSLSEIWRLSISGTLSSNLPDAAMGSWESFTIGDLPDIVDFASTVVGDKIIVAGGCNAEEISSGDCTRRDGYVVDVGDRSQISPDPCPAPRRGPVLVPNVNTASDSFSSQVFLLLGTFNSSAWDDAGALEKGEVAILDFNQGTWSRVIPAGDPTRPGNSAYPSPREGAAAVTYSSGLVGDSRSSYTDTIVFGGRDTSGKYLSEVWLLRAYSGTVTDSSSEWSGYADGNLESGVDASGAGVRLQYLSSCASAITQQTTGSPAPTSTQQQTMPTPTSTSTSTSAPVNVEPRLDTSIHHKVFAPLSVALFLPAIIIYRLSLSSSDSGQPHLLGAYLSSFIGIVAYALGIAGLATSFTTLTASRDVALAKRESTSRTFLTTNHGKAGLALFVGLYCLMPVLVFLSLCSTRLKGIARVDRSEKPDRSTEQLSSSETPEKADSAQPAGTPNIQGISRSSSPRPRTHSWGPSSLWRMSEEERNSTDSESAVSSPPQPQRTFEVINRPTRRLSEGSNRLMFPLDGSRDLSSVDWLQRRRTLNAVGELDYAITQTHRAQQSPSTGATIDALVASPNVETAQDGPRMRSAPSFVLHALFHACILGLGIISLITLWARAPRATFAVFFAWVLAFYALLLLLAWKGRPRVSVMATVIFRLRARPPQTSTRPQSPVAQPDGQYPFPSSGPYVHQPPYRAVHSTGHDTVSVSHEGPRSVETDDDDDEDEDSRQRRIEAEMERREVSIVTVPRRALWITNPS